MRLRAGTGADRAEPGNGPAAGRSRALLAAVTAVLAMAGVGGRGRRLVRPERRRYSSAAAIARAVATAFPADGQNKTVMVSN